MSSNPGDDENVAKADDLTRIAGIGTKIAKRLNEAGIGTYAELASRLTADIMALLPDVSGLPSARVDQWRREARKLAAAQPSPESPAAARNDEQHYESFLLRVLLNEDGSVRRTTMRHVGTGTERHWPGPGADSLPDFIQASARSATPPAPAADAAPPVDPPPTADTTPAEVNGEPAGAQPAPFTSPAILSVERTTLRAFEPFTMTITIDLTGSPSHADRLGYSAVVVAKPLGSGPKRTVAQSDGLVPAVRPTISMDAAGLSPGAYRLDGAVSLFAPGGGHPLGLAAVAEGFLVYVPPA